MKTLRTVCIYSLLFCFSFVLLPSVAVATEEAAATTEAMPDLLGDDFYTDEADEDWESSWAEEQGAIDDPFEPVNRFFFAVNDKLYYWVLKPVSRGYSWSFPYEVRNSFAHFFTNLGAPVRLLNSILQGNSDKSLVIVERFFLNTTLGGLGFFDVAQEKFALERQKSDFGQTLGRWGFGFGPYLYVPFLGPSSLRGMMGIGGNMLVNPARFIYDDWYGRAAFYSVEAVNTLSLHPNLYDDLRKMTLDPYVAARQAYYDYRSQVVAESMP